MEAIVLYALGVALSFAILYSVIHAAVRTALAQHYKVVRWYEATGEWLPRAGGYKETPTPIGSLPPTKPLK